MHTIVELLKITVELDSPLALLMNSPMVPLITHLIKLRR